MLDRRRRDRGSPAATSEALPVPAFVLGFERAARGVVLPGRLPPRVLLPGRLPPRVLLPRMVQLPMLLSLMLSLLLLLSTVPLAVRCAATSLPELEAECRWDGRSLLPEDATLAGSWPLVDWRVRGAPRGWAEWMGWSGAAGSSDPDDEVHRSGARPALSGGVSARTGLEPSGGLTVCAGSLRQRWGLGVLWPSGQVFGGTDRVLRAHRRSLHEVAPSTSRAVPRRMGAAALWRWPRRDGNASSDKPAAGGRAVRTGGGRTARTGARGRELAGWVWRGDPGQAEAPVGDRTGAWGLAFSSGGWGVSVGTVDDLKGSSWAGSVVGISSSRGTDPGVLMVEAAGRYDRARTTRPELAAGLVWTLDLSRALGVCRGRLWTGPAEGLVTWRDVGAGVWGTALEPGWELIWDLPRRAGTRGEVRLSVLHRSPDALGRSLEQRDARIRLATFLGPDWAAEVRLRHSETLAALPADQREVGQALGRRGRTSLEVRAGWNPAGGWESSVRLLLTVGRSGSWASAAADAPADAAEESSETPVIDGDPAQPAWPPIEPGDSARTGPGAWPETEEDLMTPGPWQSEQTGGATALRLAGPPVKRWRWGLTAVVTRAGGYGTCYVPLQRLPGYRVWKGLGEGTYLMQLHVSRPAGGFRFGGAVEWIARPHRETQEAQEVQVSIGVRWRSP